MHIPAISKRRAVIHTKWYEAGALSLSLTAERCSGFLTLVSLRSERKGVSLAVA
jgi:hypothetical protein